MQAWVFLGAQLPLRFEERETPRPGAGEVVVEMRAAGLCHSDVGFLEGTLTEGMPKPPPIILGHEVAGVIAELGPGVSDWRVGDRVVANGSVEFCPGLNADGGFATHCLLPTNILIRLPENVSFVQGAAATDAGQTSYGGVMHAGGCKPGMKMGIIGLGGLGMTGARIAVLHGAEVYAAEPRRESWHAAKAQGVREVFADVAEMGHLGLEVFVDFAGFGVTTAGAIEAVRFGGTVVQVGLGVPQAMIPIEKLVAKAVRLQGSVGGQPGDTEKVIAHMAQGELAITASTIGFDEIPEGLERLHRAEVIGRLVAEIGG